MFQFFILFFFFSSRRRHTRYWRDWSSDVCSSDLSRCTRTSPLVDEERRRRARARLRDGAERAGARAHFRAMGIDPARLDGPIVGVASTWTGTMQCNLNQRELSDAAARAITAAGGV